MFSAPIPGQSLTSEPKNYAWENPPEFEAPEDALLWHMDRLESPEKLKALTGLLSLGLDVVTLTEGILRGAVAEGRHTIDVSMIIAPVIHEFIVGTADAVGIEYNEGLDDPDSEIDLDEVRMSNLKEEAEEILKSIENEEDIDLAPLQEDSVEEVMAEEVEDQEEPKVVGLMARRA